LNIPKEQQLIYFLLWKNRILCGIEFGLKMDTFEELHCGFDYFNFEGLAPRWYDKLVSMRQRLEKEQRNYLIDRLESKRKIYRIKRSLSSAFEREITKKLIVVMSFKAFI
jgi:hypothetical protein